MSPKRLVSPLPPQPKTLLVGLYTPYNKLGDQEAYFAEFISLVKTLGIEYEDTFFTKLRTIDKANFLTKGKLEALKQICEKDKYERLIFSEILLPFQERNLEEILEVEIYDREKLILEIFKKSAHTAEGKLQVKIAEIEYLQSRIAGKGIEMSQQEGLIGTRGPGETAKEVIKRHYTEQIRRIHKKLKALEQSKRLQRKQRQSSKIPLICLVGYTNAGKSTILNQLTKSDVLVEDKLFATLDTTTRKYYFDGHKFLISDTVGFISDLPHHLIAAFKTTLEELQDATLLLCVIDVSNKVWRNQIKIVLDTLQEINVKKPILYLFNKIDKLSSIELENAKEKAKEFQPHIFISAQHKTGLNQLLKYIKDFISLKSKQGAQ